MTSKIRILSEHTINKIAAGEVIENPASVVKELVENSIDSGASEICVEIKGGGRQLIRVSDNGSGMGSDDALLCLERHATSKIREVEDIYSIHTMGFRGEAVPSIASISKFTILTSLSGAEEGTMVMVEGGNILQTCPVARHPGTTIEVKSLFFNIPVRKKFQKSPMHDSNEIFKLFSNIALGNPHIKFQLISNQETLLLTPSYPQNSSLQEKLQQRIASVLGDDFLSGLCPIEGMENDFKLAGFIGLPSFTRHNRTGQHLFINQRAVLSPLVSFAVRDGYGTALMTNRHPVYVLHLTLPGGLIDVNVHPQKREVRLRQEQAIRDMIIRSVEQALRQTGSFSLDGLAGYPENMAENSAPSYTSLAPTFCTPSPSTSYWIEKPQPDASFEMPPQVPFPEKKPLSESLEPTFFTKNSEYLPLFNSKEVSAKMAVAESPVFFSAQPLHVTVLTTLKQYILLDGMGLCGKEGLCLVDQRAAHARVIYEKLLNYAQTDKDGTLEHFEAQNLLIPYTFETTPIEARVLVEQIDYLNRIGIGIHQSAPNAFSIDAIPQIFGNSDLSQLISNIVQSMRETGDQSGFKKEREKQIALAASRAAISQNKRLSIEEAQALINQLIRCQTPSQSPLGRPTWIQIGYEELSKRFQG